MVSKSALRALALVLTASVVLRNPTAWGQAQEPVDVPCRTSWKAHRGGCTLSFSLDGHQLVTCRYDAVQFRDFPSGKELRRFSQESRDGKARIWDEISPKQRRLIKEVPVDDYVPWYDDSRSAKKRRRDLKEHRHIPIEQPLRLRAVLLADNHRVALSIEDSFTVCPTQVLIYDLKSGHSKTVYTSGRKDSPTYRDTKGMTLSHNSRTLTYKDTTYFNAADPFNLTLIQNSTKNDLCFYDIDVGSTVLRVTDKIDGLGFFQLSFSSDDKILANTASTNLGTKNRRDYRGRVTLWNVQTGERIARVRTEGRKVSRTTFSPNGRDLAVLGGTDHNAIYIASLETYKIVRTLPEFQKKPGKDRTAFLDYGYTPGGDFLVGTTAEGTAIFWDARDYHEVLCARLSRSPRAMKVAFAPDGKQLVAAFRSGVDDGMVKVWDMKDFIERMSPRDVPTPKLVPRPQTRGKSRKTEK